MFNKRIEMTRRETLACAGGVVAGFGSGPVSTPIIDTHQHLWDLKRFSPPWLSDPSVKVINRRSSFEEYNQASQGLNVVKTIYMEVDVAVKQQMEEADWVRSICGRKSTKMVAGTISSRPGTPGFREYAKRFEGDPYVKGLRQVLQVPTAPPGLCLTPGFVRDMKLSGELGLRFDLCMRRQELKDAAKLIDLCPKTQFVLDHCGNAQAKDPIWTQWERDIAEVAKRPNVICKVSGIIKTVPKGANAAEELEPIIHHVVESFGWDRVVFGSDWPVCNLASSYAGWVGALNDALRGESASNLKKLYHDNAARFYRV